MDPLKKIVELTTTQRLDVALLCDQKRRLVQAAAIGCLDAETAEGLLGILDSLQDEIVKQKLATEAEVFGTVELACHRYLVTGVRTLDDDESLATAALKRIDSDLLEDYLLLRHYRNGALSHWKTPGGVDKFCDLENLQDLLTADELKTLDHGFLVKTLSREEFNAVPDVEYRLRDDDMVGMDGGFYWIAYEKHTQVNVETQLVPWEWFDRLVFQPDLRNLLLHDVVNGA